MDEPFHGILWNLRCPNLLVLNMNGIDFCKLRKLCWSKPADVS